jgi:hypothetical protein
VTLTNTGLAPLTISKISLASTQYAQVNTCPSGGASLAPGASCRFDITFAPTVARQASAWLDIVSNAGNGTAEVTLSGTGTLPTGTFLTDSFENGGDWTWSSTVNSATLTMQTGAGTNGTTAIVLAPHVGMSGVVSAGATPQTHTRFCFSIWDLATTTTLAQGRDAIGRSMWEIDYDAGAKGLDVYVWNAARARTDLYLARVVTSSQYSCLDVELDQETAGHLFIRLGNTLVGSAYGDYTGSSLVRLYFWNDGSQGTIAIDDVSVKSS